MKSKYLLLSILTIAVAFSVGSTAFAADYTSEETVPGLSGIQPGDTLSLPDNAVEASLTAKWGVRVTFLDSDGTVLKSLVIPEEYMPQAGVAAPDNLSEEYGDFLDWVRVDNNDGESSLTDEYILASISGPGPYVFQARYENSDIEEVTSPQTGDYLWYYFAGALIGAIGLAATIGFMLRKQKRA